MPVFLVDAGGVLALAEGVGDELVLELEDVLGLGWLAEAVGTLAVGFKTWVISKPPTSEAAIMPTLAIAILVLRCSI